jgi:hypothetical protein
MRHDRKLAVGTIATAAVLLGGVSDAPQAGQARGSLGVTVKVIAACSASLGSSGTVTTGSCTPAGAPLAVAREAAPAGAGGTSAATAGVEAGNDVEYVTLFY